MQAQDRKTQNKKPVLRDGRVRGPSMRTYAAMATSFAASGAATAANDTGSLAGVGLAAPLGSGFCSS